MNFLWKTFPKEINLKKSSLFVITSFPLAKGEQPKTSSFNSVLWLDRNTPPSFHHFAKKESFLCSLFLCCLCFDEVHSGYKYVTKWVIVIITRFSSKYLQKALAIMKYRLGTLKIIYLTEAVNQTINWNKSSLFVTKIFVDVKEYM